MAYSVLTTLLIIIGLIAKHTQSDAIEIPPPRIVGGTAVASPNDYPYQISLRYNGGHLCGGTIISTTHVVTAAHCIVTTNPAVFSIQAGIISRANPSAGQVRGVSRIIVHPGYDKSSHRNDIALLVLSSALTFGTTVNKIVLPAQGAGTATGAQMVITGWGSTQEGGGGTVELRKATVPVVSMASCRSAYRGIVDSMICAGQSGKDTCQGDSGGPMATGTVPRVLVGVTSFGAGCGRPGYPGVYSRVSSFRDWIRNVAGI